jgi:hypothetical protein
MSVVVSDAVVPPSFRAPVLSTFDFLFDDVFFSSTFATPSSPFPPILNFGQLKVSPQFRNVIL